MYQEAITSKAKKILSRFKNFPDFYLAGGTGLALQLGHRVSLDFDFFWQKDIPEDTFSKLQKVFKDFKVDLVTKHSEQLNVTIGSVDVSFAKYIFPVILNFVQYQGIDILPILEIAAMKSYAIGRRATLKDYVDIYFILKKEIGTLEEIIALCEKKYGKEFDTRLFLEQLVYSEDIKEEKIKFLGGKVSKPKIEKFFEKEIEKIKI